MYGPTAWFLKVSLLLVSIRVFNFDRRFVIFWYAFIAAMALYYVPVLFIKANICHPIGGFWDSSIPTRCLSQRIVFVADTTISAVTDTAVLLAPVPVIRALRLPPMAKMRVYLLLGAGGVATIASCIRMYLVIDLYLGTQSGSGSQTVDFVKFNLLGYVLRLPWREHMQLIMYFRTIGLPNSPLASFAHVCQHSISSIKAAIITVNGTGPGQQALAEPTDS